MGKRIVPLGDGLWDLFEDGPRFGGATANFACHASLMGGEVFMVSGVGKDERGGTQKLMMFQSGSAFTGREDFEDCRVVPEVRDRA